MDTQTETNDAAPMTEADLAAVENAWAEEELAHDAATQRRTFEGEALADWYVNKTLTIEAEIVRIEEQAKRRVRALQGRLDGVQRRFGAQVRAWLDEKLTGAKKKSVDLESGRLGLRAKPATVDYGGDKMAVKRFAEEYAPAAEAYVEVTPPPKPDVRIKTLTAAVLSWIKDHGGEQPPGMLYIPEHDAMYVQPPK